MSPLLFVTLWVWVYFMLGAGTDRHDDSALLADAVVIATGGSAFDQSEGGLMSEFAPHLRYST